MKVFSTFTGIGGFELGIGHEHEIVGYSEINKYAVEIYKKHFPEHKNYGDITKINEKELPDFDLLVGGFPCQAFSIAGLRRGFADTRGTLFFDLARILREKRPRLFLFENVKGLLSHDGGNTFKTIIATLTELGYDLQWQVINSKNHGVPQNRERILIVGNLRGTPRPKVFPIGISDQGTDETCSEEGEEVANTIKAKVGGPDLENSYLIQKSQDWREKGKLREYTKTAPTIRANMGDNHPMIVQRGRGKNMGGGTLNISHALRQFIRA
jgi:DNA (cytosine-5)-methyltransferase 1